MKKISVLLLISVASLFLTGCWKRKKKPEQTGIIIENTVNEIENKDKTIMSDDSLLNTISYVDGNKEYELYTGKTIFADDENNENVNIQINNPEEQTINQQELLFSSEKNMMSSEEINLLQKQKENLGTVQFEFDKYVDIKPSYKEDMNNMTTKLIELYKQYPNIEIIIEGHACNSCGSERYNLELSNKRAETVKAKILSTNAIPENRIFTFGCGTSHLIVHGNRSEQSPNRRAEIFIITNA